MAHYLKNENNLIVWHVMREETEQNRSNIGLPAHYDMTTDELLEACLDTYKADKEKKYRFVFKRAEGEIEIPFGKTLKEAGFRNGDFLEIIAV